MKPLTQRTRPGHGTELERRLAKALGLTVAEVKEARA